MHGIWSHLLSTDVNAKDWFINWINDLKFAVEKSKFAFVHTFKGIYLSNKYMKNNTVNI